MNFFDTANSIAMHIDEMCKGKLKTVSKETWLAILVSHVGYDEEKVFALYLELDAELAINYGFSLQLNNEINQLFENKYCPLCYTSDLTENKEYSVCNYCGYAF